jgi:hypothetical protein
MVTQIKLAEINFKWYKKAVTFHIKKVQNRRSVSTKKAGKSQYDLYSLGVT